MKKLSKSKIIFFILILTGLFVFCEINNQYAEFGSNNQRLLNKIQDLQPDIIVITGDMIDANHTKLNVAVQFCEQVVKFCPVYVITGNHQLWLADTEQQFLYDAVSDSGAVILDNEILEISKN